MKCNPNIDASVGLGIVWRFSFLFNKRTWVKIPPQVAYGVINVIVAFSRFWLYVKKLVTKEQVQILYYTFLSLWEFII